MPRRVKVSLSPAPSSEGDLYGASPVPDVHRKELRLNNNATQDSPSPATSVSSDKENYSSRGPSKGKNGASMGPPRRPSPDRNKRKRASEQDLSSERARRRRTIEAQEVEDSELGYDPDQDIEERRRIRSEIRGLSKVLAEGRIEFLDPNSTGIEDLLREANRLSDQVKQTADATIDSRLLVQAAEFMNKKTLALTTGDSSQGIDIGDFISKCKNYMRGHALQSGEDALSSTQRRRGPRAHEDDEDIDGDMLDWEYLGRNACVKHTLRPAVPGFLLGPLSVEKRARKAVNRKAAFKPNTLKETRPEVVEIDQIEKRENANLSTLCTQILERLETVRAKAMSAVDEESPEEPTRAEADNLCDRHGISLDGGFALFKFVINPHSFGQTIENMFYTSFLIRDGKLGIAMDERGLPYLEVKQKSASSKSRSEQSKHQAILALDMTTWRELIDVFDIKESIIPHREEEEHSAVGAKGWYA